MAALSLIVAACNSSATAAPSAPAASTGSSSAPSAAAPSPSAAQPYAGTTLTLETYASVPEMDYYKTQMAAFTAQTGINVNYVQQPVDTMDQKIPLQLTAKDSSLDVFFTGSEKISAFTGSGGVEPLDKYINDPTLTSSDYNFKDIAPAVEAACQSGGVTYCIASHAGGGVLYYNTAMFAAAGITAPPNDMTQLLADAIKLNTPDHAGFCVRGDVSQNLYDGFQLWNHFIPYSNPITGTYFDTNWNFLIGTEPQASQYGTFYRDILQQAAPKGISTYLVTNCLQDFQQGRVAMWQDDSGTIPQVLDPTQSKVANSTAFWEIPCQPVNPDHCALVQPFGVWMNAASTHKDAAWQLIQFITSKATQVGAATSGALLTPSRNSVFTDPAVQAKLPPTFLTAELYVLAHPDAALLPFIPEAVSLIPAIATAESDLMTSSDSVASIMATMKAAEDAIMKKAGYPKPFPSF
ncbi:MAG TPA: extracellular solute-binding protein [Candidatus Saccharimonadales bacterium]|nr:extracellular solute-binding protein [Candidatus Saccharimonadales bacterium]